MPVLASTSFAKMRQAGTAPVANAGSNSSCVTLVAPVGSPRWVSQGGSASLSKASFCRVSEATSFQNRLAQRQHLERLQQNVVWSPSIPDVTVCPQRSQPSTREEPSLGFSDSTPLFSSGSCRGSEKQCDAMQWSSHGHISRPSWMSQVVEERRATQGVMQVAAARICALDRELTNQHAPSPVREQEAVPYHRSRQVVCHMQGIWVLRTCLLVWRFSLCRLASV